MERCPHGRIRKITECWECEINEAEDEICRLKTELSVAQLSVKCLEAEMMKIRIAAYELVADELGKIETSEIGGQNG